MSTHFNISPEILYLSDKAISDIAPQFAIIDQIAQSNTEKVLAAFHRNRVSDSCFNTTTGYGYNDKGRETLNAIFADIFNTDAALVSIGFVNGTHAITAALFAAALPGHTLLSVMGAPYDTLRGVIGISSVNYPGSLADYGVSYSQIDPLPNGLPDFTAIENTLRSNKKIAAVFIQRSRGYSNRPALSVSQINQISNLTHNINPNISVIVDNCYGEFTESSEPSADLLAGSLIKNPGGSLAPTGGYVTGKKHLVKAAAFRLTAPGIGCECGPTLGINRLLFQGLFFAPHIVAQALKSAVFAARLLELLGFNTSPKFDAPRSDIIQAVELGSPQLLENFCKGIQAAAPVDSFLTPEPWDMPGYDSPVIMAAGSFIQGSSIELSADAPLRPPYTAFLQGGITFESAKLGIMLAASFL